MTRGVRHLDGGHVAAVLDEVAPFLANYSAIAARRVTVSHRTGNHA